MSRKRAKLHHYLIYGVYRAFEGTLRIFPMELVCLIGGLLGNITWLLMPGRKRTVIRNLQIAFGKELSKQEIKSLCRRTFQTTGSNMIASIRAVFLSDDELNERITFEGREHVQELINNGEGFIGLLAHMGNWELLAQLQRSRYGIPAFGGMYRPLDNPLMDRLIKRRREKSGARLFSRRDGFFKPTTHLKEGKPLGIFADQHAGKHGVAVPLFGKLTSMTNLPAILHLRTDAPLVPLSVSTVGLGRWKLRVHPLVQPPADIEANTKSFVLATASAYEQVMRDSPMDILWMHNYWRVGNKQPLKIDGAKRAPVKPLGTGASQPFRVLIYAPEQQVTDTALSEICDRLRGSRIDIHLTVIRESIPASERFDGHITPPVASDPPYMLTQSIEQRLNQQTEPIDLALDLTPDASGAKRIKDASVFPTCALQGPFQAKTTRKAFASGIPENETERLSVFLESLGLNAK